MALDIRIISGTSHPQLAQDIVDYLGVRLSDTTVTQFPDGETFVKINENIRGRDIFFIQPTSPPTNENLMELLIMVDAAKRASAARITAVIPFFGYARQDRKDQPRVPITAKLVANLLTAAGVNRVLTMDLHAGQIQGFFDIPVDHLYAKPVLIKYVREKGICDNLVVVSPDVGGMKMAHSYSKALECPLAIVAKNRVSATEVEAISLIGEVEGCNVLLVDDISETAGTLTSAAKLLQANGAKRIFAGVSHAVLGDVGRKRIEESDIEELVSTDSTPFAVGPKVTAVSVAELLGEAIRRIHLEESVTSLFDIS
ncbi:MAG: ribose-phosphate pyrophosphokinase [Verrucomicrobiales bacterium]|nr:ribose-phosphate pyrophosphokinase [Verrucomicrobiales bacterium]